MKYKIETFGDEINGYNVRLLKKRWYGWQVIEIYYRDRWIDAKVLECDLKKITNKLNNYADM